MKVRWSRAAVEDLREAEAFIATDSPLYAQRFVARLLSSTRKLSTHPRIGRSVPEADDPDVRELIVYGYRIIYRLTVDSVDVLAVAHGARDLGGAPEKPWEMG
jgi:plasmid stabilization system protein ParE